MLLVLCLLSCNDISILFFSKRCRTSTKFLGIANAFSGGIFLGIGLFHLLPEGQEKFEGNKLLSTYPSAYFLAFCSYSLILFIEKVAFNSHQLLDHGHGHSHEPPKVDISSVDQSGRLGEGLVPNTSTIENEDEAEEAYKRAVTTKGKLASFLFLRNSLINNEPSGPGPAIDEERKKEQNDLLIDPNQVDIHTNEENHDNEQHKHEHDHDEHEHEHGQTHNHPKIDPSSFTPYILLIALGFHGFFEGLALGLQENLQGTLFLFVAIMAHKWAESLTLGISFVKAKATKKSIILMCSLFSIIGPLGVVVGILLSTKGGEVIEGIFLGLSTGTFLYVACSEVIVEEFAVSKYKIPKFILYLIGGVFTAFLAVLEHLNGGHEH